MSKIRKRKFFLSIPPSGSLDPTPEQQKEWIIEWVNKIKRAEIDAAVQDRMDEFKQALDVLQSEEPYIYTLYTLGENFVNYIDGPLSVVFKK